MTQQNSQHIVYLDILRVLATFAVVFIHITADGLMQPMLQYNWYVAVVGDSLVRWAVPVFVMISGALFLNPEKEISYKSILTKKVPRLLIAYISWWLIYALAIILVWHFIKKEPIQTDWIMPHYHLWFLPMLMVVYLLIPVLRKIAANDKLLRIVLSIWLFYLVVNFVFYDEINEIMPLYVINILIGYSGYFLLGYYISTAEIQKWLKFVVYFMGLLGAIMTIGGSIDMSIYNGGFSDIFISYLSVNVMAMSLAVFVFIKENIKEIKPRTSRFVDHIRHDLFGIYLVHPMWLMIVNKNIFRDLCNHVISLPIICILTFVLCLYTVKLIRRIPVVRRIVE